jgi:hypothetical protein
MDFRLGGFLAGSVIGAVVILLFFFQSAAGREGGVRVLLRIQKRREFTPAFREQRCHNLVALKSVIANHPENQSAAGREGGVRDLLRIATKEGVDPGVQKTALAALASWVGCYGSFGERKRGRKFSLVCRY